MNEEIEIEDIPTPKWRRIFCPILWILDYFADSRWYTTYNFEQKLIKWYIDLKEYIYGIDWSDYGRRAIVPSVFVDIYKINPLLNELFKNAKNNAKNKDSKDGGVIL